MSSLEHLPAPTRFAIIGGGSAGLTAARTLLEQGYRDIAIIEAADQAGGKCRSEVVDGRPYDVGAVIGTRAEYSDLLALVQRHGLAVHDTACEDLPVGSRPERLRHPARTVVEMLRYVRLVAAWRGVERGEMRGLSAELCETFATVARRRGLMHMEKRLRPIYMGMGFGAAGTIPMAYLLSFLGPRVISSVFSFGCFGIREGFQEVWVREARALEREGVRFQYRTRALDIQRNHHVRVQTDGAGAAVEAEKLIVACDPSRIGLDATEGERALFVSTRREDYHVLLCRIQGLPEVRLPTFYFVEENLTPTRAGHVMILYRKFPETDVYAAYVYSGGLDRSTLERQLAEDVRGFGGRLTESLGHHPWAYFPHFPAEALQRGAVDDLARLQGQRHTIYVGEWTVLGRLSRTMANARLMTHRLIREDGAPAPSLKSWADLRGRWSWLRGPAETAPETSTPGDEGLS